MLRLMNNKLFKLIVELIFLNFRIIIKKMNNNKNNINKFLIIVIVNQNKRN